MPSEVSPDKDSIFMQEALALARAAAAEGEVPVGAVIVHDGTIVGRGKNRREGAKDPLGHAEIVAIAEAAAALGRWRLLGCTLYVTLEPCPMCAGALVNARVDRLVFGAHDPKAGAAGSVCDLVQSPKLNHRLSVSHGVAAVEAALLLKEFFGARRKS